ncbi:MAG: acyl-CoA synthetase [Proteobacteria bacterium]|nr:acyl-CoA synthetase [Pseudomonadota bacterium]
MTLLRIMTFLSLRLGRTGGRIFLQLIAAYFFTFAPTARRHARAYLRKVLGREPTAADRYRHVLSFATTIHDRVYLLKERFDLFDITLEGESVVQEALVKGQGAFLMGAHVGSFEMIRAIGRQQPGLRVAMAMYEDNARQLNAMLAAINPTAALDVIALGHIDAMLKIQECLDRGTFVGVLGDRTLGNEASLRVDFLGQPARFPIGAMRAAAIMRRPVIFMIGLYRGGNRYHVAFESLADFSTVAPRQREAAVQAAIGRYALLLEKHVRRDPYNWFNFFDFWRGGDA